MIHLAYVSSVTLSFSITVKKRKRKGEKEKKETRARSCHSNYRLPPSPLEFDSRAKTIPELRIFSRNRDFPSKVIEMLLLLLLESENPVVEERGGGGEKAKNLNFWARGPRLQRWRRVFGESRRKTATTRREGRVYRLRFVSGHLTTNSPGILVACVCFFSARFHRFSSRRLSKSSPLSARRTKELEGSRIFEGETELRVEGRRRKQRGGGGGGGGEGITSKC